MARDVALIYGGDDLRSHQETLNSLITNLLANDQVSATLAQDVNLIIDTLRDVEGKQDLGTDAYEANLRAVFNILSVARNDLQLAVEVVGKDGTVPTLLQAGDLVSQDAVDAMRDDIANYEAAVALRDLVGGFLIPMDNFATLIGITDLMAPAAAPAQPQAQANNESEDEEEAEEEAELKAEEVEEEEELEAQEEGLVVEEIQKDLAGLNTGGDSDTE